MTGFSDAKFRESDPTYLWKIVLRISAILLAIASTVLIAWSLSYHPRADRPPPLSLYNINNQEVYYSEGYSYRLVGTLPWGIIPLSLSIFWNVANLLTCYVRQGRSIHSGANVACDLVLWLGLLATGVIASFGANLLLWEYAVDGHSGKFDGSEYGEYSNQTYYQKYPNGTEKIAPCPGFVSCEADKGYTGAVHAKGVVIATGIATTLIVMLAHLALFVSACRYTDARRRRHSVKQAKTITEEAAILARKMISDMTGPGGGFIFVNGNGEQLNPVFQQGQGQPDSQLGQEPQQERVQIGDAPGSLGTSIPSGHTSSQETQERIQQPFELAQSDLSPLGAGKGKQREYFGPLAYVENSSAGASRNANPSPAHSRHLEVIGEAGTASQDA